MVKSVSANLVASPRTTTTSDDYQIIKFMRSNQGTCINQVPVVSVGRARGKGECIADGPATKNGEISLGKNALIGFMTWEGYNYEDAVLINEKIVRDDVYTSIHIEEYEIEARDTKLGPEEITRDIPNVSEELLKDLDDRALSAWAPRSAPGDILVGKVTPKGETELTAEERLLRAIFGEKARRGARYLPACAPRRVRHRGGREGLYPKQPRRAAPGVNKVVRCYIAQKRKISVGDKMAGRHGNKGVVSRILPEEDMPFPARRHTPGHCAEPLGVPSRMNIGQVLEVHLGYGRQGSGLEDHDPRVRRCSRRRISGSAFGMAGLPEDGKDPASDGRTGEYFDNPVTVGYMYYLKLHHLVDDKIHARSTGPYSWLPSSLWAARPSSAASVSARWKCGPWRPTAPPTPCRRSSPSSPTTWWAA